jgi:glycerol-3-phosphate dehydrogenase
MPSALRVLIETLRWGAAHGAVPLNYVAAEGLVREAGRVVGVRARDRESGRELVFRAPLVVNAAGPWCRALAAREGCDVEALFRPTLAWNVLLDRPPLSEHALGVAPRRPAGPTYFLLPFRGATLAGTVHAPWSAGPERPRPTRESLRAFLDDLNRAVPGFGVAEKDVARVFAGLLPGRRAGSAELAAREVLVDHGAAGGPAGLLSLSGVKFTTARRVAERAVRLAFPGASPRHLERPAASAEPAALAERPLDWLPDPRDRGWLDDLARLADDEAALHLDDLLLRRSSLGESPARALRLAAAVCERLGWDGSRREAELQRLSEALAACAPDPGPGKTLA